LDVFQCFGSLGEGHRETGIFTAELNILQKGSWGIFPSLEEIKELLATTTFTYQISHKVNTVLH
jgi:hypothetical protein